MIFIRAKDIINILLKTKLCPELLINKRNLRNTQKYQIYILNHNELYALYLACHVASKEEKQQQMKRIKKNLRGEADLN